MHAVLIAKHAVVIAKHAWLDRKMKIVGKWRPCQRRKRTATQRLPTGRVLCDDEFAASCLRPSSRMMRLQSSSSSSSGHAGQRPRLLIRPLFSPYACLKNPVFGPLGRLDDDVGLDHAGGSGNQLVHRVLAPTGI